MATSIGRSVLDRADQHRIVGRELQPLVDHCRLYRGSQHGWASERHAREQAEHDAKMAQRAAETALTGKKPGGRPPAPPVEGPLPTDQINLTDEQSRIMPMPGTGFEQCYNAQAVVAAGGSGKGSAGVSRWKAAGGSLLVIAADVTQAPNDKQPLEPMLDQIAELPDALGQVGALLADNGYFSEGNVNACRCRTPRRLRQWATASRRPRASGSTPCASKRPSRCSASSNRCLGFDSSCSVASTVSAASGTS